MSMQETTGQEGNAEKSVWIYKGEMPDQNDTLL